eukprot:241385-Pleurochrysis_carterae.AAC.2
MESRKDPEDGWATLKYSESCAAVVNAKATCSLHSEKAVHLSDSTERQHFNNDVQQSIQYTWHPFATGCP